VYFKQRNGNDDIMLWSEEDTMRDRRRDQDVRRKIWKMEKKYYNSRNSILDRGLMVHLVGVVSLHLTV